MGKRRPYPIAVAISDIHFSLQTLELASQALSAAMTKARNDDLPLVIAGDLIDTKALLRGEVVNRLVDLFKEHYDSQYRNHPTYLLIGNHDLINEKGKEHSLNFLKDYAVIIDDYYDTSAVDDDDTLAFIAYQHDSLILSSRLAMMSPKWVTFVHQGVHEADKGHYIVDKSAVPLSMFEGRKVVSGHYHAGQALGDKNTKFSYLGSPYTITFAEANQLDKGYSIIHSDGSLERVPLNLRAHVVIERHIDELLTPNLVSTKEGDIVKVVVRGPYHKLKTLNKDEISKALRIENFILDLIPDKQDVTIEQTAIEKELSGSEVFDAILGELSTDADHVKFLKDTWKELLE